jgi:hypothetical protein
MPRYTVTFDIETDDAKRALEVVKRGVDQLSALVSSEGHRVERVAIVPPAAPEAAKPIVDAQASAPAPAPDAPPVSKKGS